jgi:hypothetical protein
MDILSTNDVISIQDRNQAVELAFRPSYAGPIRKTVITSKRFKPDSHPDMHRTWVGNHRCILSDDTLISTVERFLAANFECPPFYTTDSRQKSSERFELRTDMNWSQEETESVPSIVFIPSCLLAAKRAYQPFYSIRLSRVFSTFRDCYLRRMKKSLCAMHVISEVQNEWWWNTSSLYAVNGKHNLVYKHWRITFTSKEEFQIYTEQTL